MSSTRLLAIFFNAALCCALAYGIVAAIAERDLFWAIAYGSTLIKQLIYIVSIKDTSN